MVSPLSETKKSPFNPLMPREVAKPAEPADKILRGHGPTSTDKLPASWRIRWEEVKFRDSKDSSGATTDGEEGYLADGEEGSDGGGCMIVRIRPGYVFDKAIGKERRRIAMDDFVEEKQRRRREGWRKMG